MVSPQALAKHTNNEGTHLSANSWPKLSPKKAAQSVSNQLDVVRKSCTKFTPNVEWGRFWSRNNM